MILVLTLLLMEPMLMVHLLVTNSSLTEDHVFGIQQLCFQLDITSR